jgi:hypothetical protein
MLEVKDALGHHVQLAPTTGGSNAQLDMWMLMLNKVNATTRSRVITACHALPHAHNRPGAAPLTFADHL